MNKLGALLLLFTFASAGCAAPFDVAASAERECVAPIVSRGFVAQLHGAFNEFKRAQSEAATAAERMQRFAQRPADQVYLDPALLDEEIAGIEASIVAIQAFAEHGRITCGLACVAIEAFDLSLAILHHRLNNGSLTGWPGTEPDWRAYTERIERSRRLYVARVADIVRALPYLDQALESLNSTLVEMRRIRQVH